MRFRFVTILLLLTACSSKPAPIWQATAHTQLANYIENYLAGDDRFAAAHFDKAVAEIGKTGDPTLMGRALLTRCALETASLVGNDCPIEPSFVADRENATYHAFVTGRPLTAADLPKRYRPVAAALEKRDAPATNDAIVGMDDPVSRIVAVGVAVRRGIEEAAILETGAATASAHGWKRPLLAYLLRLKQLYERAGNRAGSTSVEARIKALMANNSPE